MSARIVFMGTPEFAVPSLRALMDGGYDVVGVVTQPDRPAGRGREVKASPVKRLAYSLGLHVLQPSTLREADSATALADMEPEVIVVAAYGLILPRSVLDVPGGGCLNVHGSLLPRHRGAAPIPAAILAGDEETGVTIMLMDEGMDTGPILAQATCRIGPDDTTASLTERLAHMGAACLIDTLPRWLDGEIRPQPQVEALASYAPMIRKSDSRINWSMPATQIERHIRAYHPWPGSVTLWQGRQLRVLSASPVVLDLTGHQPGRVVDWKGGAAVVTGEGLLLLEEVQQAGRRPLRIGEFLRGQRKFVGSLLGDAPSQ